MSEALSVDVAGLRALGGQQQELADRALLLAAQLREATISTGNAWGSDRPGKAFEKYYLSGSDESVDGIFDLVHALERTGGSTVASAEAFAAVDVDATAVLQESPFASADAGPHMWDAGHRAVVDGSNVPIGGGETASAGAPPTAAAPAKSAESPQIESSTRSAQQQVSTQPQVDSAPQQSAASPQHPSSSAGTNASGQPSGTSPPLSSRPSPSEDADSGPRAGQVAAGPAARSVSADPSRPPGLGEPGREARSRSRVGPSAVQTAAGTRGGR